MAENRSSQKVRGTKTGVLTHELAIYMNTSTTSCCDVAGRVLAFTTLIAASSSLHPNSLIIRTLSFHVSPSSPMPTTGQGIPPGKRLHTR